jgi:hypothetical protein
VCPEARHLISAFGLRSFNMRYASGLLMASALALLSATGCSNKSEVEQAQAEAEKAKHELERARADADKAKAQASRLQAQLELAKLKAGSSEKKGAPAGVVLRCEHDLIIHENSTDAVMVAIERDGYKKPIRVSVMLPQRDLIGEKIQPPSRPAWMGPGVPPGDAEAFKRASGDPSAKPWVPSIGEMYSLREIQFLKLVHHWYATLGNARLAVTFPSADIGSIGQYANGIGKQIRFRALKSGVYQAWIVATDDADPKVELTRLKVRVKVE